MKTIILCNWLKREAQDSDISHQKHFWHWFPFGITQKVPLYVTHFVWHIILCVRYVFALLFIHTPSLTVTQRPFRDVAIDRIVHSNLPSVHNPRVFVSWMFFRRRRCLRTTLRACERRSHSKRVRQRLKAWELCWKYICWVSCTKFFCGATNDLLPMHTSHVLNFGSFYARLRDIFIQPSRKSIASATFFGVSNRTLRRFSQGETTRDAIENAEHLK